MKLFRLKKNQRALLNPKNMLRSDVLSILIYKEKYPNQNCLINYIIFGMV